MGYISLLPQSYRKQRQLSLRWAAITLGIAIAVGVLAIAYVFVQGLNQIPLATMRLLQMQYQANEARIQDVHSQDEVGQQVTALTGIMTQAAGAQPNWLDTLIKIGDTVPDGIKIRSMDAQMAENIGIVNVSGECGSHDTVAGWIDVLKSQEDIAGIDCKFSSQSQDTKIIQFELSMMLPPTTAANWLTGGN